MAASTQTVTANGAENSAEKWPLAAGFQVKYEQRSPVTLKVTGVIPSYARGILYRTGPAKYKIDTAKGGVFEFKHWFDGLSQTHQFKLEAHEEDASKTKVTYRSRSGVDELVEKVRKTGRFDDMTFGRNRDPCESFFRKATSVFKPVMTLGGKSTTPIGVTLTANMPGLASPMAPSSHSTKLDSLIAKTDHGWFQKLDPENLEPLGICHQTVLHPELVGPLSAAHARTCPVSGDVFNFNLELAKDSTYRVFRASPETGQVDILAKFQAPPTYMHSFFLTQSTIVLCLWGARYTAKGLSVLYHRNIVDSLAFDAKSPAQWFVIDRTSAKRGVIATYTSPTFFCFHTINAYEEPSVNGGDKIDIIADLSAYEDLSIIQQFYYDALVNATSPGNTKSIPHFCRWRLSDVPLAASTKSVSSHSRTAELISKANSGVGIELPTINRIKSTLPYRYVYAVRSGHSHAFVDAILKYDTQSDALESWYVHGHTPGEPIFIPDPDGKEEDDGVLLSVILDGFAGRSYLLCLNANTMEELGRAQVPGIVPFGFHGLHLPENNASLANCGD